MSFSPVQADLFPELLPYPEGPESPPAGFPEPSLDSLLADLPLGWRVNTLCQSLEGDWFCNLRNDWTFTTLSRADTPVEALLQALDRLDSAKPIPEARTSHTIAPKVDLQSLMAAVTPAVPLKRRF